MEKDKHKWLKERAIKWLRFRGYTDIRCEVSFAISSLKPHTTSLDILGHCLDGEKVRIDVVGYRNGEPVIGIECGTIRHTKEGYQRLPFPIFLLPFRVLGDLDADDGDDNNVAGCRPWRFDDYSYMTKGRAETPERKRGKYPWTRGEGPAPWA